LLSTQAQDKEKPTHKKTKNFDPNTAVLFSPVYTAQFPFGNMQDRFGFNNLFGFAIHYKMKKNWLIGLEGNFLYGTKVRDYYVLDKISTSTGQFISQNNDLIFVRLQEQGFNIKFNFGKIIPFSEKYPDAGLLFMTGFGMLQHKISINVRETSLPQLNKTYRKGYDRLCNGPVFSQFIGGIFMERRKFISAYAGLQFDLGFTGNRRNYDFYSMGKLKENRIDMFLGIKVGWIIPYFLQASEKEFYYY
jgi:hypothetical protein